MNLEGLAADLRACGLMLRGGFHPAPADGVPSLAGDRRAATVLLVGNAGRDLWPAFRAASEFGSGPESLNRWTRRILDRIADGIGAVALYPFEGPPYLPFQRWAQRADAVHPSPVGMLIHPDFGLWHAYRGALVLDRALDLPRADRRPSPCETCRDRPCLTACPVDAFGADGYDVAACAGHVGGPAGTACRTRGCRARRACPVGRGCSYLPAHAAFHMAAFLDSNRGTR
jgi:hypothetical protein